MQIMIMLVVYTIHFHFSFSWKEPFFSAKGHVRLVHLFHTLFPPLHPPPPVMVTPPSCIFSPLLPAFSLNIIGLAAALDAALDTPEVVDELSLDVACDGAGVCREGTSSRLSASGTF